MDNNPSYKDIDLILSEKQRIIDKLQKENQSLLKIISHDIRAPFTQLFAMMQLIDLESDEISDNLRHYLDRMYHSLASGMEMIRNLHDVRAIERDDISVVFEEIRIVPLIEKVIQGFDKLAGLKSISLNLERGSLDPEIKTDSYILEKILTNIVSNAIKYSENGSRVSLRLEKRGDKIMIITEDEGPGIPESEIKEIFEKYRKLSPKPTLGESTTGLGLYVTEHLTCLIKGTVEVENLTDTGLRVKIILPEKASV